MRTLTVDQFTDIIATSDIQRRLKGELKYESSAASLPDDWADFEIIAVNDKTGAKGVLLVQPSTVLSVVQYELRPVAASSTTGRVRAIICDFCYTWQRGSNAGSITLINNASKRRVGFLCCADLACSRNVRSLTEASKVSRTQLRENLDDQARIDRLKRKLEEKVQDFGSQSAESV